MKIIYRILLLTLILGMLTSCQNSQWSNANLFKLQSSDAELTSRVRDALLNNPELAPAPVQVEAHQGIVTLSGYVKTIRQSDMALEIATRVNGVKSVQNSLIVRK